MRMMLVGAGAVGESILKSNAVERPKGENGRKICAGLRL